MKRVSAQSGFTLIEAMVAMTILAVVLLGTAGMLSVQLSGSMASRDRVVAASLSQGRLDRLMRVAFDSLSSHSQPLLLAVPGNSTSFRQTWSVAPGTGLSAVSVSTSWTDRAGSHTVTLDGGRAR